MQQTIFSAPDIECGGCARAIQKALGKVEGISDVQVDIAAKTVAVAHNLVLVSVEAIATRLEHAGFPAVAQ
ncbi:heavy-metal-associated domain-containing protein [Armatimonas sp.]|uniref:heavy-metal-associated domain-containing protein n=1 Tax=Armatimonas sp. TaxID=1872638 RepID=UPI0037534C13